MNSWKFLMPDLTQVAILACLLLRFTFIPHHVGNTLYQRYYLWLYQIHSPSMSMLKIEPSNKKIKNFFLSCRWHAITIIFAPVINTLITYCICFKSGPHSFVQINTSLVFHAGYAYMTRGTRFLSKKINMQIWTWIKCISSILNDFSHISNGEGWLYSVGVLCVPVELHVRLWESIIFLGKLLQNNFWGIRTIFLCA